MTPRERDRKGIYDEERYLLQAKVYITSEVIQVEVRHP